MHHLVPGRESFTLSDVPASCARPERAAFVRSMAASTHSVAPSMRSWISDVQDPDDDWWDRDVVEDMDLVEAEVLNLLKLQVCPAKNTNEQTPSTSRSSTSSRPSVRSRPIHSRDNSQTSIRSNETRRFHYPIPPSKPPSPTFPPTHSLPPHPSTALLLDSRSPSVRRLILERPNLLTALETTRLPLLPSNHASSAPTPPWYVTWPTASSTLPLQRRTLLALRTSNLPRHPTSVISPHSTYGGGGGGQLTHFARAVPFRWTKATRARGPATDFAHPSFAGSVAGTRALWVAGYREANYRDVGALSRSGTDGSDCYASRAADPVSGVAGRGRERRVWRWEGHWLRRGGMRGLKMREERVGGVSVSVVGGKEYVGSGAWEGKSGSWRKVLGRVGSEFSETGEKLPKQSKQKRKEQDERPKKRYVPLPPEQDYSGWYSDSDSD